MSKNKRLESLQALRAIAFLAVVASHCGYTDGLGACGVSIFFVMSGFLMLYNYFDGLNNEKPLLINNVVFATKRIRRLYPLHIFMMLVAFGMTIVKVVLRLEQIKWDFIAKFILNAILVHSWIPNNTWYFSFNSVSWYLSTCVFLYFSFFYVLRIIRGYKNNKNVIIMTTIVILIQVILAIVVDYVGRIAFTENIEKWVTYICPIYRLGDFIVGCNLGYLFLNDKRMKSNICCTIGEMSTIILLLIAVYIYEEKIGIGANHSFKYSLLFLPITMSIVYLFALGQGILSRLLTNRIVIYIGNISGFAFLIHLMIIRCLGVLTDNLLHISLNRLTKTIIVLILSIGATEIYLRGEKYFKRRIVKWKKSDRKC